MQQMRILGSQCLSGNERAEERHRLHLWNV